MLLVLRTFECTGTSYLREIKKIHFLLVLIVENYPRNYETVVVEVDLPIFPPESSASDR
jgi:hypothetical protein